MTPDQRTGSATAEAAETIADTDVEAAELVADLL